MSGRTRVAVVVFVDLDTYNVAGRGDAIFIAERAVTSRLANDNPRNGTPIDLPPVPHWAGGKMSLMPEVRVHDVVELGRAIRNGYAWAEVSEKAYPREDDDE